ncbi:50S ribosomal protein L6 [Spectribacter hydrogenoxidans]|uniref:Large ribosomal subunit protein uL6 n=1 Tax=Spectribacter hydrogenoxidans TaxID=3075608 RepID=A0ABU3C3J2_9GAMM|nr:50S ribosomal protein L6 [Salinisphaera sp. W335]MDT0636128.1 50S ribosomal protein L6 [Salinisphaera sp. W335]
MSRVAKAPITIPSGTEVKFDGGVVSVKGKNGVLEFRLPVDTSLEIEDGEARAVSTARVTNLAMAGSVRAIVANMVHGVSEGFERKLELVGVGYRAQAQGKNLNLALGFSHPVVYEVPEGVTVETPSQTEVLVKGADKQAVGQAAANIRAFRPPEPYKGKGVRYADERVIRKEAKKK